MASARLRLVSRACFRSPFMLAGGALFLLFVYVFSVGRHGWDEDHTYVEPAAINMEYSDLRDISLQVPVQNGSLSPLHPVTSAVPVVAVPVSDDEEAMEFSTAQRLRQERIQRACADSTKPAGFVNALVTTPTNLTYCATPRSANTFWLQMLRYSQRDFTQEVPKSPLDLEPRQVRTRSFIRTRRITWKTLNEADRTKLLQTKIFLAVQDPYWRLWTTYLNAFTLPDYWHTAGLRIESKRDKPREAVVKGRKPAPCGDSTTFSEFVDYVMTAFEPDFQPYYLLCDPCQLRPTYIIKSDTSKRDNFNVLTHLNLTWAVELPDLENELKSRYIRTVISENMDKLKEPRVERCVSYENLAKRLWHSFVLQGLLPDRLQMPEGLSEIDKDKLADHVIQQAQMAQQANAEVGGGGGGGSGIDRRKYMVAAYRHLRRSQLAAIKERYKMDFSLFGFDPEPADIFETM